MREAGWDEGGHDERHGRAGSFAAGAGDGNARHDGQARSRWRRRWHRNGGRHSIPAPCAAVWRCRFGRAAGAGGDGAGTCLCHAHGAAGGVAAPACRPDAGTGGTIGLRQEHAAASVCRAAGRAGWRGTQRFRPYRRALSESAPAALEDHARQHCTEPEGARGEPAHAHGPGHGHGSCAWAG